MIDRRSFIGIGTAAGLVGGRIIGPAFGADAKPVPGATVTTTSGKVRGTQQGKVQAFKGLSYGASTAGDGRFMPPAKPKPWTGVRDAFELGTRSPQLQESFTQVVVAEFQPMDRAEPMGEDCLHLNVWTAGVGSGKRPVMVWLHGGGYTSGSGGFVCYDGTNLAANHDVVVVTVNHRLNAVGYLYLAGLGGEKYANASNVGQLDIVAALEWVRDNIAAFGGDPGNVTIFGQSGGAGKVSTLMAMPSAKGLFHRAVVESGAALKGMSKEAATKTAEQYLARLNLKPNQVDQLQKLPIDQVTAATEKGGPLNFAPVVDGHSLLADPFDPTAPAMSADIPLLIGTVETEVTFFAATQVDPIEESALHARVKQTLRKATDAQVDQVIAAYKSGRPKASARDLDLIIASDGFRRGILTEAQRKAAQGKGAVYQYYFTWRTPVREGKLRTPHAFEIPFVFDNWDTAPTLLGNGPDRQALANKVSSAWVAFARTGNPNCKELPHWDAYEAKKGATMILDNECRLANDPHGTEQRLLYSLLG